MDIYYINSMGEIAYLDRLPYRLLSVTELFDYEWSYSEDDLTGISNVFREYAEKDMDVVVSGSNHQEYYDNLSRFTEIIDVDVVNKTPGRLYVGEYFIRCYFLNSKKKDKYLNVKQTTLTLTLLAYPHWIKETLSKYRYEDKQSTSGYDYPHDYPHSYGVSNGFYSSLENDHFTESNFVTIIYGYAVNPCVVIGGNVYRLNCTIKEGDRVVINSADQTITLIHANDQRENAFRYRDQTNDIFRKIQPGTSSVLWNAKFDFDIWLCVERSEPEWST